MLTLVLPSTSREKFAPVTVLKVTFIVPILFGHRARLWCCPKELEKEQKACHICPPTLALQFMC